MVESHLLELERTTTIPSTKSADWSEKVLSFLLSEISKGQGREGSVYGESDGAKVQFKVSSKREKMLTKEHMPKVVIEFKSQFLAKLITYVNKSLLSLKPATMGCGILRVKFNDERSERLFTIFSRRSGTLGDFIQIDQFKHHL